MLTTLKIRYRHSTRLWSLALSYLHVFNRLVLHRSKHQAGNSTEATTHLLIEDVRDAVGDLVQLIRTYQSKGTIFQVMMSTMVKRRQKEAEAVIQEAIGRLQVRGKYGKYAYT